MVTKSHQRERERERRDGELQDPDCYFRTASETVRRSDDVLFETIGSMHKGFFTVGILWKGSRFAGGSTDGILLTWAARYSLLPSPIRSTQAQRLGANDAGT